jgi:DNA-binding response OmpR family regulator
MAKILLVEDDIRISRPLGRELGRERHTFDLAEDGEAGWQFLQDGDYDLAILDIMLPLLTGLELCARMRAAQLDVPVLLLTALDSTSHKVKGLDAGADDYLVKPFQLEELHARIRALLRRRVSTAPVLLWGAALELDPGRKTVRVGDTPLELTPREYQILELLMRSSGQFFSADEILDKVWGWEANPGRGTVKTHVKGLRDKLRKAGLGEAIETQYGRGYRLS